AAAPGYPHMGEMKSSDFGDGCYICTAVFWVGKDHEIQVSAHYGVDRPPPSIYPTITINGQSLIGFGRDAGRLSQGDRADLSGAPNVDADRRARLN
ncbi:MAG TPA: hypothetical protein VN806_08415, partial [Caulobacteraceae bacterium]|nr:hypothetical protein [Caulobacteraceae bacterium]